MIDWLAAILCTMMLTAVLTLLVRSRKSGNHPIWTGVWLWLAGLAGDWLGKLILPYAWIVSYHHIPDLAAGFFFSPLTALAAGILSALSVLVEYQLFLDVSPQLAVIGGAEALTTLLVTGYAVVVRRYIFDQKTPSIIPAGILGVFGEFFHLGIVFSLAELYARTANAALNRSAAKLTAEAIAAQPEKLNMTPCGLEFIYSAYPYVFLASAVTLAIVCWNLRTQRSWRREFSPFAIGTLLFGAIAILGIDYALTLAERQTDRALNDARKQLVTQIEEQISFMLHRNAISLRDKLSELPDLNVTVREMENYAGIFDVNEINVISRSRRILASNLDRVMQYKSGQLGSLELNDFLALCSGKRDFVKNPFRRSLDAPLQYMCYVGVPFPKYDAFLQMGYSWEHLLEEFPVYFFPMFDNVRIGAFGYFIITDEQGKIAAPVPGHSDVIGTSIFDCGMTKSKWAHPADRPFENNFFGVWGRCCWYEGVDGCRIYAVLPYAEYFGTAMQWAGAILLMLFFVSASFRILMLRNAHTQQKLDEVRANDMKLAAAIQNSELRKVPLDLPTCRVTATMTPAKEVGGDFYDYVPMEDGRVAIAIADVSGKGIPAAFVMMKACSILEASMYTCNSLVEAVQSANESLHQGNDECMFVTAWIGLFDPADGSLEYVSAGHNPPLLRRADGSVEWIKPPRRDKPLALFPQTGYTAHKLHLLPGDTLYLYTDGVTEAMDRQGNLYGEQRLEAVLPGAGNDLIAAVTADLEAFTDKAPQADDITMLTLEVKS